MHDKEGRKEKVMRSVATNFLDVFTQYASKDVKDDKTKESLMETDKIFNPRGAESIKEITGKGWNNLSGREYEIKTGEKTEAILKKLGQPLKKETVKNSKYDEIWEYDFCKIYFRKSRVQKLDFIDVKEPAFRYESQSLF